MRQYIFGHTDEATALEVKNYPYGRLRTSMFYWIETVAKKGDRLCQYTINPKNGRQNATKKSTFSNIGVMYLDEKGHTQWAGIGIYTKEEVREAFIKEVGEGKLNPEQLKQLRQLRGEVIAKADPITGDAIADWSAKWEREAGRAKSVKITFDRPDGVQIKEIFEALRTLDQSKLNEVFEGRESESKGHIQGSVTVCARGGVFLGTVSESEYKEYLASDTVSEKRENEFSYE